MAGANDGVPATGAVEPPPTDVSADELNTDAL
jgi:hypothetical protein